MTEMRSERAYIVSPHQDDAVLSIGSHLLNYRSVDVANLFTRSTSHILPDVGEDIDVVSSIRKAEDQSISQVYGFRFHDAGMEDSEVRGIAWDDRWAPIDQELVNEGVDFIQQSLPAGDVDMYIPAGFGMHPDHLIAHMAAVRSLGLLGVRSWYVYADQPYYSGPMPVKLASHDQLSLSNRIDISFDAVTKTSLLRQYPSQLSEERISKMSASGAEYIWVGSDELANRMTSDLRYHDSSGVFGSRLWHQEASKHILPSNLIECITMNEAGMRIIAPFSLQEMQVGGQNMVAARLNGAGWLDYADFEGSSDLDTSAWNAIRLQLRDTRADALWISGIKEGSELYRAIKANAEQGDLFHAESSFALDCHHDGYHAWRNNLSARMRSKVRRIERKKAAFIDEQGGVEINTATSKDIAIFLDIQRRRAQASDGSLDAFGDDHNYSAFLAGLSELGELKVVNTRLGDEHIGSMLFHEDSTPGGILSIINQGFIPEYRELSPGFIMQLELIKRAHEQGARMVDYLKGDDAYKRDFTNREVKLYKYMEPLASLHNDRWQEIQNFGRTYVE
jgi:hypothetical protein